ncbi:protein MCM10 homolog [Physella acuta]|uniref:protein MCM10 homolog n=1 Tax=Physella acuta TaxID=109671 RepID=UPI0027DD4FFB|nr:protein MCM10 homolog [Physella acuta]
MYDAIEVGAKQRAAGNNFLGINNFIIAEMASDEFCDQETLEALLNDDEDSCQPLINTDKNNVDQSVEDFLNALSDDSDSDDETVQKCTSVDKDNIDALATSTNDNVLGTEADKNSAVSLAVQNVSEDTAPSSQMTDLPMSTQALQEEMMKMQQKMLELQKMLAMQQQLTLSSVNIISPQPSPSSVINKPHGATASATPNKPSVSSSQNSTGHVNKSQGSTLQNKNSSPQSSSKSPARFNKSQGSTASPLQNKVPSSQSSSKPTLPSADKTKLMKTSSLPSTNSSVPKQQELSSVKNRTITLLPDSSDILFSNTKTSAETSSSNKGQCKKSNSLGKSPKRSKMESELFGDSDSDWEGLDGEDKKQLSDAGKEIKQIMHSGDRRREAHQPNFSVSSSSTLKSGSWSQCSSESDGNKMKKLDVKETEKYDKNSLQTKSSSSEQAKPAPSGAENEKVIVEDYSKIRIINPLVSSSLMRMRMEGRKMISVSRIHQKLKTPDLQGDWVTIAVVVGKSDSKSSSSGKPYSIWKLNDLEDLDNSVSFFLFGEVHKHMWKTAVGTVIGVLNPSIMESMEKNNSEPAFTVKNANQVMIMGQSKDLHWCIAKTKAGNKCIKFINRKYGDFCAYHVAAEYRKTAAQRLEFHGSINGTRPKSFEKKIFSKDCAYIYGGNTFVPNSSSSNKKNITLNKLKQTIGTGRHQKVNTLSIHDIKPEPVAGGKLSADSDNTFAELITVPSPGSMNLVAFLKTKEEKAAALKTPLNARKNPAIQSVTPKDLIKQHQQAMQQKMAGKKKASELLLSSSSSQSLQNNSLTALVDPLKQVPQLGKGFYGGQEINLDITAKTMSLADRTKLKAVAAILGKGGLKKEDPNAVKKDSLDHDKIKKRLLEDTDKCLPDDDSASPHQTSAREPPKKKSRLLGNVDLNSDEVKGILKAKSKHKGALAEAEAEREEVYFTELEKKEKMEEKMQSVTSIEITVVSCSQCSYTAQSALDTCKKEGHKLKTSKAKKRFFMCKKCKHRTYVIGGKFPTDACKKCGTLSFEKTSMYKIRSGPKLDSEILNIRGDEIKYLNSMDQKCSLNVVPDT